MVVTYSIQELRAIGEDMRSAELKDLFACLSWAGEASETAIGSKLPGTGVHSIHHSNSNAHHHVGLPPSIQKLFEQQKRFVSAKSNQHHNQAAAIISSSTSNNNNNIKYVSQLESYSKGKNQIVADSNAHSSDFSINSDALTKPVAEFFKKAQQNFYSQANIDPTKVRRLSEVEAELCAKVDRVNIS